MCRIGGTVSNNYIKRTEYGKENRVPEHLSTFPIGDENTQYAKFL